MNNTLHKNAALYIIFALFFSNQALSKSFIDGAVGFIGQYLLSKAIDEVWDKATGKPDVVQLQSKVKALEEGIEPKYKPRIENFRQGLDRDISYDHYKNNVYELLAKLSKDVSEHDSRIKNLEQDVSEIKKKLNQEEIYIQKASRRLEGFFNTWERLDFHDYSSYWDYYAFQRLGRNVRDRIAILKKRKKDFESYQKVYVKKLDIIPISATNNLVSFLVYYTMVHIYPNGKESSYSNSEIYELRYNKNLDQWFVSLNVDAK